MIFQVRITHCIAKGIEIDGLFISHWMKIECGTESLSEKHD